MHIGLAEINAIVENVWASTLGYEAIPVDDPLEIADGVTGSVGISEAGAMLGRVYLHCSREVASSAAAVMFRLDLDAVGEQDAADTVGELINMIGGNIKSLLAENSQLEIPTVVIGGGLVPDACVNVCDAYFVAEGGPFRVMLCGMQ